MTRMGGLVIALLVAACGSAGPSSLSSPTAGASATPASSTAAESAAATPPSTAAASALSTPIRALDAHLLGPDSLSGLAVDAAGNLYVSQCQTTYAAIDRVDTSGMMTMFAGTGEPGFSGDGGPAASAHLFCPYGMAFGPDGALYVADHINNRVRRVDSAGTITTIAGSGPAGLDLGSYSGDGGAATSATLQEPTAVAFDAAGNLYISDRDNNRIRKVDTHGIISTIAGNGASGAAKDGVLGSRTSLDTPYGVVADANGDVILVDGGHLRVRKVDRHGIIRTIAGTGVDASTGDGGPATRAAIEPQYVALDAAGNSTSPTTSPAAFGVSIATASSRRSPATAVQDLHRTASRPDGQLRGHEQPGVRQRRQPVRDRPDLCVPDRQERRPHDRRWETPLRCAELRVPAASALRLRERSPRERLGQRREPCRQGRSCRG